MRYDTTLKQLFRTPPLRLLSLIAGTQPIEFLTLDYPAVKMRRPDLVFRLPNGEMRHIELQSDNDQAMDWRMLEYYPLLYRQFGSEPVQQVLYVGSGRVKMKGEIRHRNLTFRYDVIDIRQFDAEPLLSSDSPADNLLALLCRNGTDRKAVRRIISQLGRLPEKERIDRLTQLLILSGLRKAERLIIEEAEPMSLQINLMENDVIREFVLKHGRESEERGAKRGHAKMLRLQLEQQFGKLPKWALKLIDEANVGTLEDWGLKLLDAERLEDVLSKPARPESGRRRLSAVKKRNGHKKRNGAK
jgi:predicted transposase YdaD